MDRLLGNGPPMSFNRFISFIRDCSRSRVHRSGDWADRGRLRITLRLLVIAIYFLNPLKSRLSCFPCSSSPRRQTEVNRTFPPRFLFPSRLLFLTRVLFVVSALTCFITPPPSHTVPRHWAGIQEGTADGTSPSVNFGGIHCRRGLSPHSMRVNWRHKGNRHSPDQDLPKTQGRGGKDEDFFKVRTFGGTLSLKEESPPVKRMSHPVYARVIQEGELVKKKKFCLLGIVFSKDSLKPSVHVSCRQIKSGVKNIRVLQTYVYFSESETTRELEKSRTENE
ncbi:hypothetical protein J6590_044790 [Homalodisca vitripennis]|nr:hypothetical protein J6590_044790 [Homalodisca vitripennis]